MLPSLNNTITLITNFSYGYTLTKMHGCAFRFLYTSILVNVPARVHMAGGLFYASCR